MRILELTEQEFQALAGLIDAGVRATGIRGVKDAAVIIEKMEATKEQPEQGKAEQSEPEPE